MTSGPARVLVLNAGSSSLKASVLDVDDGGGSVPALVASESVRWGNDASREAATSGTVGDLLDRFGAAGVPAASVNVVAHRVVHGGRAFTAPTRVNDGVIGQLETLAGLAPLHLPVAIQTIRAARLRLESPPHVAVFDTAFHATLPETQRRYPVPSEWHDRWGVERFGFHGLSVEWAVERSAALLAMPVANLALVVSHLGSGCSVTAVHEGRSVATSMGMTPLEGLMMGTRAGSIDPGILLALLRDHGLTPDDLAEALDHRSGLLAVSGRSADSRELLAEAASGDGPARLALDMFAERAAAGIAAVASSLPRLDAIVFTGGIGEHAGAVRAAIVERLAVLGVDAVRPDDGEGDRILLPVDPTTDARVKVLRVEAREDVVAARAAAALVAAD